jgi:hypothetical protein
MADLIHLASDDQLALAICFGAVVVSGLIMHFSLHVGRLTGRVRLHDGLKNGGRVSEMDRRENPFLPVEDVARDRAA